MVSVAARRVLGRRSQLVGAVAETAVAKLERRLLRRSDVVVVISEDFLPLLTRWHVEGSRVSVIENWAPLAELPALPRRKVLATIVRLLERTFIRIGNEEYARENKSFGLTTLKNRHVKVRGAQVRFRFRGKSKRPHEVDVTDRRVAKVIAKCQDLPGQDLFQYLDGDGEVQDITSQDVNEYLRQIAGEDFTAKDFRTWGGTVLAAMALSTQEDFQTKKQAKSNIKTAICAVAELLGNTPAVCRKCYVHPMIVEAYLNRTRIAGLNGSAKTLKQPDLRTAERAVLKFLRAREL